MSAAAPIPSVESLVAEGAEVDAAIRDSLALLAEGKATDGDVAELRRRRAGIDDRIQGARLREERAEEERRDEERANKQELLEKLVAEVEGFDAWLASEVELSIATLAMLADRHRAIVEKARVHANAQRLAASIAAELGRKEEPTSSPLAWHSWPAQKLLMLIQRKIGDAVKLDPDNDNAFRLVVPGRVLGG